MADPLGSVSSISSVHAAPKPPPGRLRWAWPLLPFGLSVFFLSALAYYHVQRGSVAGNGWLQRAVVGLYEGLGFVPGFMLCLLVLAWSSIWFITGRLEAPLSRAVRVLVLTVSLAVLVNLEPLGQTLSPHAGAIGGFLAPRFVSVFGFALSAVLVSVIALISLLFATDFFFYRYFDSLVAPAPGLPAVPPGHEVEPEAVASFQSLRAPLAARPLVEPARTPPPVRAQGSDEVDVVDVDADVVEDDEPADERAAEPFDPDATGLETEEPPRSEPRPVASPPPWRAAEPERSEADEAERFEPAFPSLTDEREAERDERDERGAERDEREDESADEDRAARDEDEAERELLPDPETWCERDSAIPAEVVAEAEAEAGAATDDADDAADHDHADEPEALAPEPATPPFEPGFQLPRPEQPPVVRQRTLFLGANVDDTLLDEAAHVVLEQRRANAALLQRRLRVGYDDAVDLIERLRQRGLVDGREREDSGRVLLTREEWEQQRAG